MKRTEIRVSAALNPLFGYAQPLFGYAQPFVRLRSTLCLGVLNPRSGMLNPRSGVLNRSKAEGLRVERSRNAFYSSTGVHGKPQNAQADEFGRLNSLNHNSTAVGSPILVHAWLVQTKR